MTSLKITSQDLDKLSSALKTVIHNLGGMQVLSAKYLTGDFPRSDRVKDLNMRFRFELYYYIPTKLKKPTYTHTLMILILTQHLKP